nr:MAG TPA: hypothetical protein [Caudoviricetes sp.]
MLIKEPSKARYGLPDDNRDRSFVPFLNLR